MKNIARYFLCISLLIIHVPIKSNPKIKDSIGYAVAFLAAIYSPHIINGCIHKYQTLKNEPLSKKRFPIPSTKHSDSQ